MTQTFIRYSDNQPQIGMVMYVGTGGAKIGCCVVTETDGGGLGKQRVWDAEERCHVISYAYRCRRASADEEAAYQAIDSYDAKRAHRVGQ